MFKNKIGFIRTGYQSGCEQVYWILYMIPALLLVLMVFFLVILSKCDVKPLFIKFHPSNEFVNIFLITNINLNLRILGVRTWIQNTQKNAFPTCDSITNCYLLHFSVTFIVPQLTAKATLSTTVSSLRWWHASPPIIVLSTTGLTITLHHTSITSWIPKKNTSLLKKLRSLPGLNRRRFGQGKAWATRCWRCWRADKREWTGWDLLMWSWWLDQELACKRLLTE